MMPRPVNTDEDCRHDVCLLCMGKTKEMHPITPTQKKIIQEYFINGYDEDDSGLPCTICVETVEHKSEHMGTVTLKKPY